MMKACDLDLKSTLYREITFIPHWVYSLFVFLSVRLTFRQSFGLSFSSGVYIS